MKRNKTMTTENTVLLCVVATIFIFILAVSNNASPKKAQKVYDLPAGYNVYDEAYTSRRNKPIDYYYNFYDILQDAKYDTLPNSSQDGK